MPEAGPATKTTTNANAFANAAETLVSSTVSGDERLQLGDDADVAKHATLSGPQLADRIKQLMKEEGWSARELARQAGLKNEKHVSVLLGRLRKGKAAGAHSHTIDAIATALRINTSDLLRSEWTPEARAERIGGMWALHEHEAARFPNLELMLQYTKASGTHRWDDTTLEILRAGRMVEEDMPPEDWQRAADHLQAQITAARLSWEQMRIMGEQRPVLIPSPPPPKKLGPKRN